MLLDMNYLDIIINQILNNFDFAYMFTCNLACFIAIKVHDYFNGVNVAVPTFMKRLYLVTAIILLGIVYYYSGEAKLTVIINSAILAPVFWSWIAAPILRKFGIQYKQADDCFK